MGLKLFPHPGGKVLAPLRVLHSIYACMTRDQWLRAHEKKQTKQYRNQHVSSIVFCIQKGRSTANFFLIFLVLQKHNKNAARPCASHELVLTYR